MPRSRVSEFNPRLFGEVALGIRNSISIVPPGLGMAAGIDASKSANLPTCKSAIFDRSRNLRLHGTIDPAGELALPFSFLSSTLQSRQGLGAQALPKCLRTN